MEQQTQPSLFMTITYPGGAVLKIYRQIDAELAKKLSKMDYADAVALLAKELKNNPGTTL